MKQTVAMITEKTGLPLGMVVALLVSVASGATFMTTQEIRGRDHTRRLDKLEQIKEDISEIKEDLSFIKGKMEND